jgi:hypothetical protein
MPILTGQDVDPREGSPARAHAAMLEALVRGEGFARVAAILEEHVDAPVGIFVPRPGNDGLTESPVERFVLMFGEGDPGAEAYLRTAALAALAGIAVMNALDDVGVRREHSLLHDLLTRAELGDSEVARRARMQGCDLRSGVIAICADPGESDPRRLVATIAAERPGAMVELVGERVYAMLPGATPEAARRLTDRLAERCRPALSSRHLGAAGARLALEEAGVLLAMAEAGDLDRADDSAWDPIRLLFRAYRADPEEVLRFAERTIGALVRQDEEHGSELQITFWAYQRSNCNMNLTAKSIYTHRHTVANRLARIRELTGLDPVNGREREHLSLALKAHYVATMGPTPG